MDKKRSGADETKDYLRGREDGKDHAKHEKRDGVNGLVSDVFSNPRLDSKGSKEYKDGWKEGRDKELKKK